MITPRKAPLPCIPLLCLALLSATSALAQPPRVHSPRSVVEQFFQHVCEGEIAQLAPLCTAESVDEIDLRDFAGEEQAAMFLFLIGLLYPTQECQIDLAKLAVEGDTATVPLTKSIHHEHNVVVRKTNRRWKIDLVATLMPSVPALPTPQALAAELQTRMKGSRTLPQIPLLSAETLERLDFDEFTERFNDDDFEQIAELLMLVGGTPETTVEVGQPQVDGDRAVVPVTKTVPLSAQLVMHRDPEGWRIDLMKSAAKSGAFSPEVLLMMRQQAMQQACANNMKQILLAVHMYAQDHNETLPGAEKWTEELLPYVGNEQAFRCPAHPEARCGYALNTAFAGKTLKEIEDPAEQVLMFESPTGTWNAADDGASLAGRHNQGALIGFADGHVQWMTLDMAREKLGLVAPQARAMPDPNAFDDYVAAAKLAKDAGGSKEAYQEKTPIDTQREVVTACAPALARLREGFGREFLNPPVRSFDAQMPHLAEFRELGRVLLVEAKLAEREERFDDAANSYLDMLRLGNDVPRGGALIHALVGIAIQGMALRDLSALAPKLDEDTAVVATGRMLEIEASSVPLWQVLSEEFVASRAAMRQQNGQTMKELQRKAGAPGPAGNVVVQRALPHIEAFYKATIAEARKPRHARQRVPVPNDPLANQLLPALDRASLSYTIGEVQRLLCLTTLALRAYEARNGELPDGLAALEAAKLLSAVPQDPFHDGPLAYRRTDDGYLLYSFGVDGDDDGGKALGRREAREPGADGDLVAE